MSWDPGYTFADGEHPGASVFNARVRDNLKHLRGSEVGQSEIVHDLETVAPGFEVADVLALFRSVYSGAETGKTFRILGESRDGPSAIATGQKVRVTAAVGERDGGTEEPLGVLEAERTGAQSGSLSIRQYLEGVLASVSALKLLPTGKVLVNQNSGSYDLDVAGAIRAGGYLQGGSAIGKWTNDAGTMKYTGSARVSGQLISTRPTGEGPPLVLASPAQVANLNASKLQGETWPVDVLTGTSGGGRSFPATSNPVTIASITAPRSGWYFLLGEMDLSVTSGLAGSLLEGYLPGGPYVSWVPMVSGDLARLTLLGLYEAAEDEVIPLRAKNYGDDAGTIQGSVLGLWLAPRYGRLSGTTISDGVTMGAGSIADS